MIVLQSRDIKFVNDNGSWSPINHSSVSFEYPILKEMALAFGFDASWMYLETLTKEGIDFRKRLEKLVSHE